MPPLTVENFAPFGQSARPIERFNEPFTVLASARPVVNSLTDPFTVYPSASPFRESASTPPLTVRPTNFTPTGTWASKRTVVSLSRVWEWLFDPDSQRFGSRPGISGYTAQIVTPPACG